MQKMRYRPIVIFWIWSGAGCCFFTQAYEEIVAQIIDNVPSLRLTICIDGESKLGPSLEAFITNASHDPIVLPNDNRIPVVISGTGGTTGKPKGVVISGQTFDCFVANMLATLSIDKNSIYLAAGAYAFPVMTQGGTLLFHNGINTGMAAGDRFDQIGATRSII